MNLIYFIAKRIAQNKEGGYSKSIIKLAIATTSLCIASIILSTLVIDGFKSQISKKIFGFWGHIHITDMQVTRNFDLRPVKEDLALLDSIKSIGSLQFGHDQADLKQTKGGVQNVVPFIQYPGILKRKTSMEGLVLKGVTNAFFDNRFHDYLQEGSLLEFEEELSRDLLISEQTSKRMKITIGDKVVVHFLQGENQVKRAFKVTGIYRTGLEEYDRKFAFLDVRVLQQIIGWGENEYAGYEIFLDDYKDAEPITDYIYQELLPSNLYAETIQEKQRSIFEWLELQDINEKAIIFLMSIVGLINMCTALLIFILERTRMIGILKSLGLSDWGVRKIFIVFAVWIVGISIVIGNFLGLGLALIQVYTGVFKLDEANYYLTEVPIDFDPINLLIINGSVILVTALVMIVPTILINRIKVIDILRFD